MNKIIFPFRVFTLLALFFLSGTMFASFVPLDFSLSWLSFLIIVLALLLCALINFILKLPLLVLVSFCAISFCLSLFYYSYFDQKNTTTLAYGEKFDIEGQIIKKPEINYQRQQVVIAADRIGTINYAGDKPKLLVKLPHYPRCYYGDKVTFSGKIEKPGKFEDFDYGEYLKRYLIFGIVNNPEKPIAYTVELSLQEKAIKGLYAVSEQFEAALNRILPEPHASLASGLILGIKRNIPESFKNSLSQTGLTHIVALSGYNVTIIVLVLSWALLKILSRRWAFVCSSIFVIMFVVLTGISSSVLRAAIFSLLIIFGKTIGRRGDNTNLLLLAALVMVVSNPYILKSDIGFQLSFLAFSGLIYLSPIITKIFSRSRFKILPEYIKLPLTETLAAQIAVFPLLLTNFGMVSLIAPFANVLVLPAVPIAMTFSFLAGLFGTIYYPLGKFFILLLWPVLQYIIKMVDLMPFSSVSLTRGLWIVEIALYVLIFAGVIIFSRKFKLKLV